MTTRTRNVSSRSVSALWEESSWLSTQPAGIASGSFPPARPPAKSSRSTRADTDEKAIRFQQGPARSGGAPNSGKTRITIRLDNDVIEHFQAMVDRAGGGNYQTLINDALREYIRGARLETVVRRAVREEVGAMKNALVKTA